MTAMSSRATRPTHLWAEMSEQPAVLRRALAANAGLVERLRALRPDRVRLAGHGSSSHAARFAAQALERRLGVTTDVVPAPDAQGGAALYRSGDLVVAISQSGRTPSILAAAGRARRLGATVVALTNDAASPLAATADAVLDCAAGVELAIPATKTFVAQAGLLLAVAAGLSVAEAAVEPIAAVLAAPAAEGPPLRPDLVVGAGSAGPIAAEVALKFAEIAGHSVVAVDAAEALHGPISAGEGRVLVLAAGDDANVRLLRAKREVVEPTLPRSSGDADADALALVVVGQRLALDLALHQGRDPDSPPLLSKVTRSA